jgi:hypothetical protein
MVSGNLVNAARMINSMVEVMSELTQRLHAHYQTSLAEQLQCDDIRFTSREETFVQLQHPLGLLAVVHGLLHDGQQQRQRQQEGEQPGSSCALGHGPDCPGAAAGAVPSAEAAALGASPPCHSCLQAHVELLAACSPAALLAGVRAVAGQPVLGLGGGSC